MKPIADQTYYEILDLTRTAGPADLHDAYVRAKKYLSPDSMVVYSLAEPGEAEAFIAKVEAAYQVLSDPALRARYDASLDDPDRVAPPVPPAPLPEQQTLPEIFRVVDQTPWTPREGGLRRDPAGRASDNGGSTAAEQPKPESPVEAAAPPRPDASPVEPKPIPAPPEPAARPDSELRSSPGPLKLPESLPLAHPPLPRSEAPVLAAEMALQEQPRPMELVGGRLERPRAPDIDADTKIHGELLRRVREARGVSMRDLADRTRIGITHLENIEADHYDALPAIVYVRGMLMSVARELRLDPVRVSRSYVELVAQARGEPLEPTATKVDVARRRS